jgi:hypothetical protein
MYADGQKLLTQPYPSIDTNDNGHNSVPSDPGPVFLDGLDALSRRSQSHQARLDRASRSWLRPRER